MYFLYIIYSAKLDRYYTGITHDVELRLQRHNNDYYNNKWTAKGKPWTLFLSIPCADKTQAAAIEQHIKKMKSKKYIQNLIRYPEIIQKLKVKYPPAPDC
jgi:putative endonuclease